MATTPNSIVTPQTPYSKTGVLTAAETAFSAPTAVIDILTAAENVSGARLNSIFAIPRAAVTTANNIQLYEKRGSTYTLIDSALMATVTPSASVASPKTDFGYSDDSPMEVAAGVGISAAMGQAIANGVVVKVKGGLY